MIRCVKFFSPEAALYLYESTIWPCLEYRCHAWAGASSNYLDMLDKLQKQVCRDGVLLLVASLEPSTHRRNVSRLILFYRFYLQGRNFLGYFQISRYFLNNF